MASLFTNADARLSRPLAHFQMPHVFVIPPEEEQQQNPPWCCFDADEHMENTSEFPSNPDIHFLDVPYLLQPSERNLPDPISPRVPVHHPRSRATLPRKLEKKQRPEAVKILESRPSQSRHKDSREDSDVIEVVKVKRTRDALTDLEENTKIKRSKTLKARATEALQSIKNVGRNSHRTHVKELWTSTESMPGIFKGVHDQVRSQQNHTPPSSATLPKKISLSRANSRSLSQLFQPTKPPRIESTFDVHVDTSVTHAEAQNIPPVSNTFSRPKYIVTNPSLAEVSSIVIPDGGINKPVSPIPPMKKSTIKKFSVRELHRLFSFSASSLDEPWSAPTATSGLSEIVPNIPMPSTCTFASSSSYPDIPVEDDTSHFVDLGGTGQIFALHQPLRTHHNDPHRLSDFSFEMKLDSLHFDALSFDPDDFDVSVEGNIPR